MVQNYVNHLGNEGLAKRLPTPSVGVLNKSSSVRRGRPPRAKEPATGADTGIGAEGRRYGIAPPSQSAQRRGTAKVTPKKSNKPMGRDNPARDSHAGTTRKLSGDAEGGAHSGTGGLEHLMPRWIAWKALSTETAYEESAASFTELLLDLQRRDTFTKTRKESMANGTFHTGDWQVDDKGLLYYQGSAYVPEDLAIRQEILRMSHADPQAGHFGPARTIELVRRKYYWPKLLKDVKEYVRGCDVCQRTKAPRHRPYGEM